MQKLLLLVGIASSGLTGCFNLPVNSLGSAPRVIKSVKEVSTNKSVAVVDANSTEELKMAVSDSNELAGTSITVAPGSLQISTSIVIEQGAELADSSVTSEVSLAEDVAITQAGEGVIVRPSEEAELSKPLTLSLPLPVGLGARLAGSQYAVYYKYFDPSEDKLMTGFKIVDDVSVKLVRDVQAQKDLVQFEGYFGIYWVVVLSRPVQKEEVPPPKASEQPIVNKANTTVIASSGVVKESEIIKTQTLPQLEWPKPVLTFDASLRTVKLTAEAASLFTVKDCKSDFFEAVTDIKGISVETSNLKGTVYSVQKMTAHKLIGRFRCFDSEARASISSWSDAVTIEALPPVTVKSLESASAPGIYAAGATITINVNFSEPVIVEGVPTFPLETGTSKQNANYVSGSGTDKLSFSYTVQAGDESSNLSFVASSSLQGSIKGKRGNTTNLTLPATSAALASTALVVDAKTPVAPQSVAFPSSVSSSTSLSLTWTAGTDSNFKQHNVKVCATNDCSSSCSAISNFQASPAALTVSADGSYYGCVQAEDLAGNASAWVSSSSAVTVSSIPPAATISGAPSGMSNATSLNITVGPAGISAYRFKVRTAADSACPDLTGYSAAFPASTSISQSISSLADGPLEICVIAQSSAGTWQDPATAASASWTKDTAAPTATISGLPTGANNVTALSTAVGGSDVSHYKYKLRDTAGSACSDSSGYSSEVAVGTPITASLTALADGIVQLCVIGRDSAGNWQNIASASNGSWTKDTLPPAATLSGAPTGSNATTTLAITVAGSDVVEYKYKVRASADTACSNSIGYSSAVAVASLITDDISAKADGTIQVCVIGKDSAGNWQLEGVAATASWTKDSAAPTATISGAPGGQSNQTGLSITIGGTDVTHYKYKIRLSPDPPCSDSSNYGSEIAVSTLIVDDISSAADGTIELCVLGRDSVGIWQDAASATAITWTKDSSAPTAILSGQPSGTNNVTSLNVTVSGSGASHYKYKLRVAADLACTDITGYSSEIPVGTMITDSFSGLADGTVELCVIARDVASNWQSPAAASSSLWTKDTAAPVATFSGLPVGSNNTTALNVTVSGSDVSHYKFKLRDTAGSACSLPSGYSSEVAVGTPITDSVAALADGLVELCVIGRDSAGNWQSEASANSGSWTKDSLPPAATLSGAPTGSSQLTTLAITIAGSDVVEYKYKIRTPADTSCSNSTGYSSVLAIATQITDDISAKADGTIEVCVIGKDSVGNWQLEGVATTASWTKDSTAPVANISGAPGGQSNQTALNISIGGTDVTHYKYKIRLSADPACSVATGYSAQIAVATFISDDISVHIDGGMELCVLGRDSAGNWQAEASASSISWTKDTSAPTATLSGQPSGTNNVTALNVTVGGTGTSHYKYKVRGPADTACSDTTGYGSEFSTATVITDSIAGLPDGSFELCVIARDPANNWQSPAGATSGNWIKDTVGPNVNAGSDFAFNTANGLTASASDYTTLSWSKVSGPGTVTFSPDSVSLNPSVSANIDGVYVLRLTATDAVGNTSFDEMSLSWDTTAPTVNAGIDRWANTAILVDASNSGGSTFSWTQISGPGTVNFSPPNSEDPNINANIDGAYTLRLTVTDAAGNSAFDEMTFNWDTTAPTVNAGPDLAVVNPTTVAASASAAYLYSWSKVSGPGTINFSSSAVLAPTVSASADGNYVLRLAVSDEAGNSAFDDMNFTWDTTAPTFAGLSEVLMRDNQSEVWLFWKPASDTVTDSMDIVYDICMSTSIGQCASSFSASYSVLGRWDYNVTGLTPGSTYEFLVRARDAAGHIDGNSLVKTNAGLSDVTAVASGSSHSCALLLDSSVKCWGDNSFGQLGNGTTTAQTSAVAVSSLTSVSSIAMGSNHSCAVLSNGAVKCWGWNQSGQLGDGTTTQSSIPVAVPSLTGVSSLALGNAHSCALVSGGTVKCWGNNAAGQLGDGTTSDSLSPVAVSGLSNVNSLAAGESHNCAVLSDATVKCWGYNISGQLGDGTTVDQPLPVAVSSLSNASSLALGTKHSCALLSDATAVCWGYNGWGQLGDGTGTNQTSPVAVSSLTGISSLSSKADQSCARLSDSSVQCWGNIDSYGKLVNGLLAVRKSPVPVPSLTGANSVAAGGGHSCALLSDETVKCWGGNLKGQLGIGTTSKRTSPVTVASLGTVSSVALGWKHSCARLSDSTVKCWGENANGQLGDGTTTDSTSPVAVSSLTNVNALALGLEFSCALLSDATVKCWGHNGYGQLGDGTASGGLTPVTVSTLTNVSSIAAGWDFSCAVLSDATVKCWGRNANGQIGDGTTTTRTSPVAVTPLSDVDSLALGAHHGCAVLGDSTVKCWGRNEYGQVGDSTTTNRPAPVAISLSSVSSLALGKDHSCALLSDETVKCWGYNVNRQLGDGTTTSRTSPVAVSSLSNVSSLALGDYHSCALLADTSVKCWGYNLYGQFGDGTTGVYSVPIAVSGISGVTALAVKGHRSCMLLADSSVSCVGSTVDRAFGPALPAEKIPEGRVGLQ